MPTTVPTTTPTSPRLPPLEVLGQDLRLAFRSLKGAPGFTVTALVTLCLGIGALTAIFSVVHGVLLAPLPFAEPDRLVSAFELNTKLRKMGSAYTNFVDWRQQAESFEALSAHSTYATTVLGGERPLLGRVASVTADYFAVFPTVPARGRLLLPDDFTAGAAPVAVVSHRFWRDQLGAPDDLSTHRLDVLGLNVEIVGVTPAGFETPGEAGLWLPLELQDPPLSRTAHNHRVVGRLAPGVSVDAADAELDRITAAIYAQHGPDDYLPVAARVEPLIRSLAGTVQKPLLLLLGAGGLVLLVACTNLASASLARSTKRRREMAVRAALGARTGGLLRSLFVESLVLSFAGAAAGLALAILLLAGLRRLAPELPRLEQVGLNLPVLLFTAIATVLTACLFGLIPGLRLARQDPGEGLSAPRGGTSGYAERRAWRFLVLGEVALACVLLLGAGLLLRSFWQVASTERGFAVEEVVAADLSLPRSHYDEMPERAALYRRLLATVEAQPGIVAAGMVTSLPLAGGLPTGRIGAEGGIDPEPTVAYQVASAGYFETLGIPLLEGRLFDDRDHGEAPHVVVINRAFADAVWPGDDPVGRRVTGGGMDDYWDQEVWATIVGIVADIRAEDLAEAPAPAVYFHYQQRPFRTLQGAVVARSAGDAGTLRATLETLIRETDPDIPFQLRAMDEVLDASLAERRFAMLLLAGFAGLALVLAAVGIHGVVSYGVARRRRELGIRLALGAQPRSIVNGVVAGSMGVVASGLGIGLAGGLVATRSMQSLLYGIRPWDPTTCLGVAAILAAVAFLASWLPAQRTSRIDPLETLRAE